MWAGEVVLAQHHIEPGGAIVVGGLWVRLLTMAALVVVAATALLRPFAGDRGMRSRSVAVVAAFVAVVGLLILTRDPGGRGSAAGALPVVLVTTALAMLPVIGTSGRLPGYLAGLVGVLALVFGTDPSAVGELLSGNWSGVALRTSAPIWVAALAWLALATPPRPVSARVVWAVGFVVATGVVAAVPGFVATSGAEVVTSGLVSPQVTTPNSMDFR